MEGSEQKVPLCSGVGSGCHDHLGGARPKVVKQSENVHTAVGSAMDARLKAQQVADKLRRKYCQRDEDTKQRQREGKSRGEILGKSPRSPIARLRNRGARVGLTGAPPMCHTLSGDTAEFGLPREGCDRLSDSPCFSQESGRLEADLVECDLCKGQRCRRSGGPARGGRNCQRKQNCAKSRGSGRSKSKYDRWKSQGLSSNWTIRTVADCSRLSDCDGQCDGKCDTVEVSDSPRQCSSSTSQSCLDTKHQTETNSDLSPKMITNTTVLQCGPGNTAHPHCDPSMVTVLGDVGDLSACCCPFNRPGQATCLCKDGSDIESENPASRDSESRPNCCGQVVTSSDVMIEDGRLEAELGQSPSLPSLTSSTSDAVLADQSSVTETSDSPADGRENNDAGPPVGDSGPIVCDSNRDKVCLCFTPRPKDCAVPSPGNLCRHTWCSACCLPLTPCRVCNSRSDPFTLQSPLLQHKRGGHTARGVHGGRGVHSARGCHISSRAPAKQSSSDSEQAQDASSVSTRRPIQPPAPKQKRKRLSSSKDLDVAGCLMEADSCKAPSGETDYPGLEEDRLNAVLYSLLHLPPVLSPDADQDLFMDYLSLNIPAEYNWGTGEDNSGQTDPGEDNEEGESQDLVSDCSTLHQLLSDTDIATDGEEGGVALSSFPADSGEESGDADDEFECDCQHCVRFPLEAAEEGGYVDMSQEHPHDPHEISLASLLPGLAEGGAEDLVNLARDHMELILDITIRDTTSRLQLLEAMFEEDVPPPATEDTITSLPRSTADQSHVDQELSCAICLSRCEFGDQLSSLPCGHLFHPPCVGAWLSKSATCPVCRHSL